MISAYIINEIVVFNENNINYEIYSISECALIEFVCVRCHV